MKIKTSELQGSALDWAVAKCEGATEEWRSGAPFLWDGVPCIRMYEHDVDYTPSTNWALAGPIIEREWLDVTPWPNESREDMRWHCQQHDTANDFAQYGPTLLIAAMRCFVASKMGDDVEIPEELI